MRPTNDLENKTLSNKILGLSYTYNVLFNAQNLSYYILVLTKLPFFSVKSRRMFTVQSRPCPPGKSFVAKSIMALALRKRLFKHETANEFRKTFKQSYGDKNEWDLHIPLSIHLNIPL